MRRLFAVLIGLAILLTQPIASSAQTPEGVIELSGGSVAAGIGLTWGSGTLSLPRQALPAQGQRFAACRRRHQRIHRGR